MSCCRPCETCKPLSLGSDGAVDVDLRNIDNFGIGTRCRVSRVETYVVASVGGTGKSWQYAVLHP